MTNFTIMEIGKVAQSIINGKDFLKALEQKISKMEGKAKRLQEEANPSLHLVAKQIKDGPYPITDLL